MKCIDLGIPFILVHKEQQVGDHIDTMTYNSSVTDRWNTGLWGWRGARPCVHSDMHMLNTHMHRYVLALPCTNPWLYVSSSTLTDSPPLSSEHGPSQGDCKTHLCSCGRCRCVLAAEGPPGSGWDSSSGASDKFGLHRWGQCGALGTAGPAAQGPGGRADCCRMHGTLLQQSTSNRDMWGLWTHLSTILCIKHVSNIILFPFP